MECLDCNAAQLLLYHFPLTVMVKLAFGLLMMPPHHVNLHLPKQALGQYIVPLALLSVTNLLQALSVFHLINCVGALSAVVVFSTQATFMNFIYVPTYKLPFTLYRLMQTVLVFICFVWYTLIVISGGGLKSEASSQTGNHQVETGAELLDNVIEA